jgi:hypothetical protein
VRRFLLLLAVLAAPASASDDQLGMKKYKVPADGATATLRFPKGNLHLSINRGDDQYYGVLQGDTCAAAQRLMIYSAGIGGNTTEKSVPIGAGQRLRILASVEKQASGGYRIENYASCTQIVAFTPEAGKTYLITQEANAAQPNFCAVTVHEEASGAPPADLAVAPALMCRF